MKKIYIFLFALTGLSSILNAQSPNWQWAKDVGGTSDEVANSIVSDASGNSYVTGSFTSSILTLGSITLNNTPGGGTDVFVAKFDPSGNAVWAKNFGATSSSFGNGEGKGIDLDASGNIYITGFFLGTGLTFGSTTLTNSDTNLFSAGEIFIVKLDGSGNVVWAKSAGGAINDGPAGIHIDAGNNVYVTGYFYSSSITFGSVTLTSANNAATGTVNYDIFVAKYNSSGTAVWAKSYGGSNNEDGRSITTDASGNVLVTGNFSSSSVTFGSTALSYSGGYNVYTLKLDPGGNVTWAKTAAGSGYGAYGNGIVTDGSSNVYITGLISASTLSFGGTVSLANPSGTGVFIVKYDSSGNPVWGTNAIGISASAHKASIDLDASGNSYITGNFDGSKMIFGTDTIANYSSSGYQDIFAAKCNAAGTFQWAKSAGGNRDDAGNGITVDPSGNSIITGTLLSPTMYFGSLSITDASSGTMDMYIAKIGNAAGIEENYSDDAVVVYPNPSNGLFSLTSSTSIPLSITTVKVMNMIGEEIYSDKINSSLINIDLSNQPKGIYFLQLVSQDKKIINKKMIIQ